jgi:thioredoxin 1
MSTKKILLIVGGCVAVLGLVVALFVGGVIFVAFSAIGKSEAAQASKTFLRENEKLRSDIGDVRDFGFWVTGNINSHNSDGQAILNLKVIGEKKTVPASVNLAYRSGRSWMVVKASYQDDAGRTVNLLDAYDTGALNETGEIDAENNGDDAPEDSGLADSGETPAGFDEESFAANVLEAEEPVLVVFLTKYSLDSRSLEQTLDGLSEKYAERVGLVRYNVDEQPALLKQFNVERMPTLCLYKNGEERERLTGAITKQNLARLLDKYLETE